MNNTKADDRVDFISFLQFVGVILVIFGHSMNGISVPAFLTNIKSWVYTFHMPLFFFVSGFLFSFKGGYQLGWKHVLKKRFFRLVVPYIFWNGVFFIPKYFLMPLLENVSQDTEVDISVQYFIRIALRPRDNILGHTWFLLALFEMMFFAIFFDQAKLKKTLWMPITAGLTIINCFGVENRWFAIEDLMKNGLFFWVGVLLGTIDPNKIEKYLKEKSAYISISVLAAGSTVIWMVYPDMNINSLILGLAILFVVMILRINFGMDGQLIQFVSKNAFPIYIMHWPVIMVVRFVFYQKIGLAPLPSTVVNMILGFVIPCGITLILRKMTATWIKKACHIALGM